MNEIANKYLKMLKNPKSIVIVGMVGIALVLR